MKYVKIVNFFNTFADKNLVNESDVIIIATGGVPNTNLEEGSELVSSWI